MSAGSESDASFREEGSDSDSDTVQAPAVRRRGPTTNDRDRARLVDAHQNGEDFLRLANQLGIKRTTAYSIVRAGRRERLPTGGAKNRKWDAEQQQYLCQLVQENPVITLADMNIRLRNRFPDKPTVTEKTLSIKLDGALFTTKLVRDLPAARNSPEVLEDRRNFAHWLCSHEAADREKIFVDEFGFDTWMRRSFGRSRRGQRAYRQVGQQRSQRVTVCLAVCPAFGVVHFQTYSSGMTKVRFGEFVTILIANFQQVMPDRRCDIIIDNVSSHNNAEDYELADFAEIHRLPRYSPFLTPVENAISCWKAQLKRRLSGMQAAFIRPNEQQLAGRSLAAYRRDILEAEANDTVSCITAAKCTRWWQHCFAYIPRCLASEPIDG